MCMRLPALLVTAHAVLAPLHSNFSLRNLIRQPPVSHSQVLREVTLVCMPPTRSQVEHFATRVIPLPVSRNDVLQNCGKPFQSLPLSTEVSQARDIQRPSSMAAFQRLDAEVADLTTVLLHHSRTHLGQQALLSLFRNCWRELATLILQEEWASPEQVGQRLQLAAGVAVETFYSLTTTMDESLMVQQLVASLMGRVAQLYGVRVLEFENLSEGDSLASESKGDIDSFLEEGEDMWRFDVLQPEEQDEAAFRRRARQVAPPVDLSKLDDLKRLGAMVTGRQSEDPFIAVVQRHVDEPLSTTNQESDDDLDPSEVGENQRVDTDEDIMSDKDPRVEPQARLVISATKPNPEN
ncbi:MAG: hypothetical protein KVP17_004928 [Porospora cf. gigantea B]|uniref:uncharacterized protein n=2 Tax=Porospora cf. gigantea B TaxID=2853592 RepID=UPI0035718068|nr:MAG: hypothetical protein KVP17_004928 [Porospora cf. gigantea B]